MDWIITTLIAIALPLMAYWHYWKWTHKRMLQLAASIPGPPAILILGKLVLTMVRSKGNTWRNHRKIVTPFYNKKSVQLYAKVFNNEAKEFAKIISKKPNTFNVYYDVVHCTTQSVCQTLLGLSKNDTNCLIRLNEVVRLTPSMYDLIFTAMTLWWQRIAIIRWLTGITRKVDYYIQIIDELAIDIISKRRSQLEKSLGNESDGEAMGIVDRFITCGELTERELKWETFTLFTTSQEAAAKITSGLLLFLAHLPDWQEKVYNEIIEVLGPQDNDVTGEDLKKLQYLDMVFKEVVRILSIAAFIQRTAEEDITIKNGTITIPQGTSVLIPIFDIHHDPQYWDEPNKIKPERFMPENVKKRDPNVFIPFSLGAMDCIGRVYATSLIKTIAVRVLRQVILEADGSLDNMKLHVAISVKCADGYHVRVRPRNSNGKISLNKA